MSAATRRMANTASPSDQRPAHSGSSSRVGILMVGTPTLTGVPTDVELRSLRNWHITVLREAGFPLEFIGRRVGHEGRNVSPLAMTASYTVSRIAQERAMAEAIEARLEPISVRPAHATSSTSEAPPAST
jgi:hypothetical protein